MVVLFIKVPEGFLSMILVLPLLTAFCGRPCSLDGQNYSFDPFQTVLWFAFRFLVGWGLLYVLPTHFLFYRIPYSLSFRSIAEKIFHHNTFSLID
jgi:hypothetical protein